MAKYIEAKYDRDAAVAYAHEWAYYRNPHYYDFSNLGGDCTNYVSQCIFAGSRVMNYLPTYGWYYMELSDRAPAWSGVPYLFNFLVGNKGAGPYGVEVGIDQIEIGDIVQLVFYAKKGFSHTPIVVSIREGERTFDSILVAAHSDDCDWRPLSSYTFRGIRYVHIRGVRYPVPEPGQRQATPA